MGWSYQNGRWQETPQAATPTSVPNAASNGQLGGSNPNGTQTGGAQAKNWKGGSGFFQYGDGQYGFINSKGNVNWKAKQPKQKNRMVNWNQVSKYAQGAGYTLPQQKAKAPGFTDPQYYRNMADQNRDIEMARHTIKTNIGAAKDEYQSSLNTLHDQFMRNYWDTNAGLAGRGFGDSGARELADVQRHSTMLDSLGKLNRESGALYEQDQNKQLKIAEDYYKTVKAAELSGAKDRWKVLNPGKKIPSVQDGFKKKNGQWFFTSKDGVEVSLGSNTPKGVALKRVRGLYSQSVRKYGSSSPEARRYRKMLAKIRKWD
jgi:hypothetical protein